jgi:hypothetical protein
MACTPLLTPAAPPGAAALRRCAAPSPPGHHPRPAAPRFPRCSFLFLAKNGGTYDIITSTNIDGEILVANSGGQLGNINPMSADLVADGVNCGWANSAVTWRGAKANSPDVDAMVRGSLQANAAFVSGWW